jgi:predicted glycosyltransferase
MVYIARANYVLMREALRFRPDLMLSVASPYLAQVGWMLRIPTVTLDDTEGAMLGRMLYLPFTTMVLTPDTYRKSLGSKQIRVNSSLEMCYLHPAYFPAPGDMHAELGLKPDELYAIVRLVSWKAVHDRGHRGLSPDRVRQVCAELSRHCRVFISSEAPIPPGLKSMQFPLPPDRLHAALSGASLYVGEGATMAAEAAMLGVPSCYVSSIDLGYINAQAVQGLISHYRNADAFLNDLPQITAKLSTRAADASRNGYFSERVDMTRLLVWLIDHWPVSRDYLLERGRIATDDDLPESSEGVLL